MHRQCTVLILTQRVQLLNRMRKSGGVQDNVPARRGRATCDYTLLGVVLANYLDRRAEGKDAGEVFDDRVRDPQAPMTLVGAD